MQETCFFLSPTEKKNRSQQKRLYPLGKRGKLNANKTFRRYLPGGSFLTGLWPATLLKKRPWDRCFPAHFAKFSRTPFLHNTSGRLLLDLKIKEA